MATVGRKTNKMEKKRYLDSLFANRSPASLKSSCFNYYKDVISDIDSGILPLVRVLNNSITITLYSCEGHYEKKSSPWVRFNILPKRGKEWDKILGAFLNTERPNNCFVTIHHRFHPKRYQGKKRRPSGPFVDWDLKIDVSPSCYKSKKVFRRYCDEKIKWCSNIFSQLLRGYR